jgi:hypothetical protein
MEIAQRQVNAVNDDGAARREHAPAGAVAVLASLYRRVERPRSASPAHHVSIVLALGGREPHHESLR